MARGCGGDTISSVSPHRTGIRAAGEDASMANGARFQIRPRRHAIASAGPLTDLTSVRFRPLSHKKGSERPCGTRVGKFDDPNAYWP